MRILHTVAFYHPDEGGGAQEVVRQVSERLVGRGHDVTVATTYSPKRQIFEHNGVKIQQFNIYGLLNHSVLGIYGDVGNYLNYLTQSNFDIIMNYAAQTWCTDLTCRVLPKLQSKKVLAACGYSGLIGLRRLIYWRYFRRLPRYLRQYNTIIYHSDHYIDKKFGDSHGITNHRIIPNGIDSNEFNCCQVDFRSLYNVQTKYMLLSVGNHFTNKGHKRISAAFKELRRKDVTLVIIGKDSAPQYRSCWKTCLNEAQRSEGRIVLLNNAPRSHVVAAYFAADIFLSGSYIEVFPLVIVESMASKTPFISFPAGNIGEMSGGALVGSVPEMTHKITRLLESKGLREELGSKGKIEQRGRYEWEAVVNQYEALYEELLNS